MLTVITILGFGALIFFVIYNYLKFKKNKPVRSYYSPTEESHLDDIQWQFLRLTNAHRKELGIPELIPEMLCGLLAVKRIKELVKKPLEEFSHMGYHPYRLKLEENNIPNNGEILAKYWNSVPGMFRNYLESEDHKDALENPSYKYIGLGIIDYNYKFFSCIILA